MKTKKSSVPVCPHCSSDYIYDFHKGVGCREFVKCSYPPCGKEYVYQIQSVSYKDSPTVSPRLVCEVLTYVVPPFSELENMSKPVNARSTDELREEVDDLETAGYPDQWKLICKASSKSQKWMKSTKAFQLKGSNKGVLVQVTTQINNNIAEALEYIPMARIVFDQQLKSYDIFCEEE